MKGVSFGGFHSFNEWGLFLSKPTIGGAEIKTGKIDIKGADGSLDYTEVFGGVKYSNRQLKFEFTKVVDSTATFYDLVSVVSDAIHGKSLKVVSDDDLDYYFIGRCSVSGACDRSVCTITVEVDAEPYKLKHNLSGRVINLAGKNLLNLDSVVIGGTNTWVRTATGFDYTQTESGGSYAYFNVPLEAGKTYTFSVKGSNLSQTSLYIYTDRIYGTLYKNSNAGSPCTFTPNKSSIYVVALITNSTATAADFGEVMLAEGSSVGTFELFDNTVKTKEVVVVGARMLVVPKIYATGEGIVTSKGVTRRLSTNAFIEIPEMQIEEGNNVFTASASGLVLVQYQEGRL